MEEGSGSWMGRGGKEAQSQANTLKDKVLESVQASEDGKEKGRLSISACGTSEGISPWTQGLPISLLDPPPVL